MASSSSLSPHDTKTSSVHDEPVKASHYTTETGIIEDVVRVTDHQAERQLCRKFDLRLLPVLALMCRSISSSHRLRPLMYGPDLFNALDKGNLSNAETDGMSTGRRPFFDSNRRHPC